MGRRSFHSQPLRRILNRPKSSPRTSIRTNRVIGSKYRLSPSITEILVTSATYWRLRFDAPFELRIMETTDIHTNLVSYDYYKDAVSDSVGFSRTATLIKQARKEVKNSVLVDNGDLIQGTPLGTYKAKIAPLKKVKSIPSIKR